MSLRSMLDKIKEDEEERKHHILLSSYEINSITEKVVNNLIRGGHIPNLKSSIIAVSSGELSFPNKKKMIDFIKNYCVVNTTKSFYPFTILKFYYQLHYNKDGYSSSTDLKKIFLSGNDLREYKDTSRDDDFADLMNTRILDIAKELFPDITYDTIREHSKKSIIGLEFNLDKFYDTLEPMTMEEEITE
jgi:hypothetical protein